MHRETAIRLPEWRRVSEASSNKIAFNWSNNSMNIKECEAECFKNSSCRAYANSDVSGGSGCLMWFGDLIDIRE
ncbi:hypothetical protein LWI29_021283 [Acer saccharum]|uniref:Apple domain-containing protein n=1 Tax=Acer saccharum TaxID=4024 RepID=A0AA39STI0_ACESA|nr:hypothetical protein LWI29_021283 [Acer saccharum]